MSLSVDDFDEFFRELYRDEHGPGPEPFPWQRRLVRRVAETGDWPDLLDLPTGAGKTAVVDAAVFLLALRGDQPRRMVFVVDRRVVVHQAARRAQRIAERLGTSTGGVLRVVADRLRALCDPQPNSTPLHWAELRGGIVRDDSWARRPDLPTVIVSTVDQVGSRLLFRGYGVSDAMRPVHAGLLGNDVLYFLDEVHLAQPFAQTLAAIRTRYRPPAGSGLPDRWKIVELSATPSRRAPDVDRFRLAAEDYDLAPALARRLRASKPARAELVKGPRSALTAAAVEHVRKLLSQVRTVGVVVNRVDTAVRIRTMLADELPDDSLVLLTGRMRPLDRDAVLARYEPRLRTGRARADGDPPLVVVATQAIEAGADLDLDALVTECAPLDALVQRFGRVDRAGEVSQRGQPPTSVILASSAEVGAKSEDPIYGTALRATWDWLRQRATLDFGVSALPPRSSWPAGLITEPDYAPHLLPSQLDRFVQTSATPDADPEPAHFLHGFRPAGAEITVVWRADLLKPALPVAAGREPVVAPEPLAQLLSLCPPGSGEAMQLPVSAVRAWLASGSASDGTAAVSDATTITAAGDFEDRHELRPAVLWRPDQVLVATRPGHLRPGDTIVVPASYVGITAACWDPKATAPVTDLGTIVQARQRGRAVLRLADGCLPDALSSDVPEPLEGADDPDDLARVREWLDDKAGRLSPDDELRPVLDALRGGRPRISVVELSPADPLVRVYVVSSGRRVLGRGRAEVGDSEPSTSPFTGVPLTLVDHLDDVRHWADRLASAVGLPSTVRSDLALAGYLHDLGKADPRFQTMLRGGALLDDEFGAELLAKSGTDSTDRRARSRARAEAGYPAQARHELASVALVQDDTQLRSQAGDWDLVLHLIASHHGYARPFVPVCDDPSPPELAVPLNGRTLKAAGAHGLERLDSGVPQRFWRCVRRYGWFGLAWLEAILRLADHRASQAAEEAPRP